MPDFDDSAWENRKGPISNVESGTGSFGTNSGNTATFRLRRTFDLTELPEKPYTITIGCGRNDVDVYVNGTHFENISYYSTGQDTYTLPNDLLKVGKNVIAVKSEDTFEMGRWIDFGIYDNTVETNSKLPSTRCDVDYTIVDDSGYPWYQEGDSSIYAPAKQVNYYTSEGDGRSKLSINFTATKPGKILLKWSSDFRYYGNNSYEKLHITDFNFDGKFPYYSTQNWNTKVIQVGFEPGEHTIDLTHIFYRNYDPGLYDNTNILSLDIMQYDDWVEVPATTGGLSAGVLAQGLLLDQVECLKITGEMNDACYTHLKQMTNLCAVDMSGVTSTSIPANTFTNFSELTYVVLPSKLTRIESESFEGANIGNIVLPETLEYIGDRAFENTWLYNISLPNSLTEIGPYAFRNTQLEEITLPNSVTTVGTQAFASTPITKAKLPVGWTEIPKYLFWKCNELNSVELPTNLVTLGEGCFQDCSSLSTIKLPETVQELGYGCLNDTKLTELNLPTGLKYIQGHALSGTSLTKINIPENVSIIGPYAFAATPLEEVILPPFNTHEYFHTFQNCTNLKKITFKDCCVPLLQDMFLNVPEGMAIVVHPMSINDYRNNTYLNRYNIVAGDETKNWTLDSSFTLDSLIRPVVKPNVRIGYISEFDWYYIGFYNGSDDPQYSWNSDSKWRGHTGHFTVNGDLPLALVKVSLDRRIRAGETTSLISNCNSFTADSLSISFYTGSYGNTYDSNSNCYWLDKWVFFTPLCDVNVADVKVGDGTNKYVIRYYDSDKRAADGTGSWTNVTEPVLKAGQGYIFRSPDEVTLELPGVATGNLQALSGKAAVLPLTAHPSEMEYDKNWNFVGNPYASFYDVYYMDYTAPITVWDESNQRYSAYTVTDDDYALYPGQAFFVQKPDNVSAITFNPKGRQHDATINHLLGVRQLNAENGYSRFVIDLRLNDGETGDKTRLVLNEEAGLEYELTRDASKFMSMEKSVAQMYTIDDNNARLAINERPVADGECRLGVYLPSTSKEYSISSPRAQTAIYLYDKETSAEAYLSGGNEYIFTTSKAGYVDDRFILRVAPTSQETLKEARTKVIAGEGYVTVVAEEGASVTITGIDGIVYYSGAAETVSLLRGIYVVTVDGKNHKVLVK